MNTIALNEYIKQLRARDPMITVTFNPEKSAIAMLRGRLADPVNVEELTRVPYDYARQFIRDNRVLLGNIDERMNLDNQRVMTDRQGMTHVIFAQKYGSAEVLGGNVAVHYAADGSVYRINSTLASGIDVPESPRIESTRAAEIAKEHAGSGAALYENLAPTLVVADAKTLHKAQEPQKYYICWRMRIIPPAGSGTPDSIYLVDAIEGEVILRYSALQNVGTGYYSSGAALNSEAFEATFRLRDTATSAAWPEATKPVIHTYDDANSGSLGLRNYSEDADDNWNNGGVVPTNRFDDQRAEVDIHRFLGYVLNYYHDIHGHNSWDNAGADVRGHVHNMYLSFLGIMPNNAFWDPDGKELYFGDGDAADFDFFTVLDVTGHELTHGVNTGFNIVQTYDGETGALNEAIADLFGVFIALNHPADDDEPWQTGEQCVLPTHRGRNMADPSRDAAGVVQYNATSDDTKYDSAVNGYFPDHYSIRYTGEKDYHGVHINCPIITHAVYLMINGGTHRLSGVTVTGIGVGPVEQMLYRVISTGLLSNTSDFTDFRLAFIEACKDLYPANLNYLLTVKTAFHAVGIGPDLGMRFIVERSTLGEDEINARRAAGSAVVPDAFRVVVDGFTAAEIGITGSALTLDVPSPTVGMTINCTGNTSDSGGYGPEEQRFTFHYDLDFGLTNDAFDFEEDTKLLTLNGEIPSLSLSAWAQLQLIKQPNPFILHGDPPYLSVDLRIFVVRAGETKFGVTMGSDASDAPRFIQEVMKALTDGEGVAGGQAFDDLSTDQAASSLYLQPTDSSGNKVFNFALAKVHYIGTIGADNVRVFFRLLSTQSTNAAYDIPPGNDYPMTGSYRFWSDGVYHGQKIALAGIQGNDYVTIPCFALPRVDTASTSMIDQEDFRTDGSGNVFGNVQSITPNSDGSEVDTFFGCWLDTNQPFKPNGDPNTVLPINVAAGNEDGPFSPADAPLSIQEAIIRNGHQCLIAEIAFDPIEIPVGKDPSNWDKLAQRNIAWNPVGSAQAVSTFEIRSTPATALQSGQIPDELMIDWGNTPSGSFASIYLPAVNVADVLAMADRMYTTHRLEQVDSHTLQCRTGGITYVPIPASADVNYVGLLSVDLPERLDQGQVFNIVVRQVTNAFGKRPPEPPRIMTNPSVAAIALTDIEWRSVLGAFQLTIPVQPKEILLPQEERQLSVFRWIQEAIPADNRWYSVFNRYIGQIAKRVDVFGGDSSQVVASPTGEWQKVRLCRTLAIISTVLLAVFIVALGILSNWVTVAAIAVFLAVVVCTWVIQFQPKFCRLLRAFIAGAGSGALILAIALLLGVTAPQLIGALICIVILVTIAVMVGTLRNCF
ncbi:M4 family metallopeptidase [Mastigocoleus sp. MO_188.B34]|uniref:M4 family metallopeptidase n=1 Tax=Mastigocoleus sp. MO_188.B34 TaxID=3036635 RepID=UPI0026108FB2|nr:M4 family metallopeptidase [Mastigocoleus sp. MO_188.B34]MDJ0694904.1 M4 family metallopeptidase [Mastigocoleus sp. MO_188.B34]